MANKAYFCFMNFHKYLTFFVVLLCNFSSSYSSELKIAKDISILSSDAFGGRGTGQYGSYLAAKYIGYRLKEIGLSTYGDDNDYYIEIPFISDKFDIESNIVFYDDSLKYKYHLLNDFVIVKSTLEKANISSKNEIVFCAYGVVAPEFDYDDYREIDVKNKIVMAFEGSPDFEYAIKNPRSNSLKNYYSNIELKKLNALKQGAKALIIIPNPINYNAYEWLGYISEYSSEILSPASNFLSIPVIRLNESAAQVIYDAEFGEEEYWNLAEINSEHKIRSRKLELKADINIKSKRKEIYSENVVAMLKATPNAINKDKYLIISAHYDHLGISYPIAGDSIYNGTLDNAAGCAVLIDLAEKLSKVKYLDINIVFAFFTAEEKGRLGSQHFVNSTLLDKSKILANINIDGVASFDLPEYFYCLGCGYTDIGQYYEKALINIGSSNGDLSEMGDENELFAFSDNFSFAEIGIPSIIILEGNKLQGKSMQESIDVHSNYFLNYYHTPFDDTNQAIDYNAMEFHSNLILELIMELSKVEKINWNVNSPFYGNYLRNIKNAK